MPVIRGQLASNPVAKKRRAQLLKRLLEEFDGNGETNGPVIFEIPLECLDKLDVVVVWQEWESVRSEDRSTIILEAYKAKQDTIAVALGVTYHEAMGQDLLPYTIVANPVPEDNVEPQQLRKLQLAAGGISVGTEVVLRFPTMSTAQTAWQKLSVEFPRGFWSIIHSRVPAS